MNTDYLWYKTTPTYAYISVVPECTYLFVRMGQKSSLPMEGIDGFTPEEVLRLEKRFKKLDLDRSGSISVQELLALPELKENPLLKRVVAVFDKDQSGELDFKEFVQGLAMFAVKSTEREKKLRFLFSIYDLDGDGFISNEELYTVLKMMVGSNLKDNQLQQIVDKTILALDKDSDGMINYKEFTDIIAQGNGLNDDDDVTTALTIPVPKI